MRFRPERLAPNVTALAAFALAPLLLASQGCSASPAEMAEKPETESVSAALLAYRHGVMLKGGSTGTLRNRSAPSGAHLTYNGGRVNSATQVIEVLWGTGSYESHVTSTGTPSMLSFFNQLLGNGSYTSWLNSEYNTVNNSFNGTKTNQNIGAGTATQVITITPSSSATTIDDSTIQTELAAQIAAGHLPAPSVDAAGNATTYYAIFFPHGRTITQGGSSSCASGGFCAYHGTVASSSAHGEFYYGVHPDMQAGSGCDTGCGSASTAFGNYTSVASHELTEMITDAEVGIAGNGSGPPLAWYDNTNGEIGDICNAQQGTYTGCDGQSYTIQLEFSNAQNNCIPFPAPTCGATADFTIADTNPTIAAGSSGSSTVSTTAVGGAGTVALSLGALPAGITATLGATSVAAGGSTTVSISVASTVTAGTYSFTVNGTEGTKTHSSTVTVTVTTVATSDFTIAASPATLSIAAGASATSTIATTDSVGAAEAVTFSVTGAPSGVTASVAPSSVTSGASATLTVATTSAVASGSYVLTVTGTAASGSHATTVGLSISGGATGGGITNGGFESGLTGWTVAGAAAVATSGCHGGTSCAKVGTTTPTNGDSSVSQTFTAPSNATGLSFWYKVTCPDTVTYDWATATLKDNTAGTTATLLAKTCTAAGAWTNVTGALTAGHSYTLTLTSHDDNYAGDPTYTLYDDVTITTGGGGGGSPLTNGGFESGVTGWTTAGTTSVATSGCHGGTRCAESGGSSPTNGDSNWVQTFTAAAGNTKLSFWYKVTCPDTVTYDWATATLKDNTAGTTTTVLAKTCTAAGAWTQVSSAVTAGHSYTLTLTSHDDNYAGDPTYTLFDDVTLQ